MAYKYSGGDEDDQGFAQAVLANANRGGENVATGALIGALMGASCGYNRLPKALIDGLAVSQQEQLTREIDQFVASVPFAQSNL